MFHSLNSVITYLAKERNQINATMHSPWPCSLSWNVRTITGLNGQWPQLYSMHSCLELHMHISHILSAVSEADSCIQAYTPSIILHLSACHELTL